jgi:hypothetical protein
VEPADHALRCCRGGFSCQLHLICDGGGLPLSVGLTSGNVNDTLILGAALTEIRIPRRRAGRLRTRPDRLLGDKGYSSCQRPISGPRLWPVESPHPWVLFSWLSGLVLLWFVLAHAVGLAVGDDDVAVVQ